MDLSNFFEQLKLYTMSGFVRWEAIKPDSKEPFYGYKADYKEYNIEIMARAEGISGKEIPLIAVKIEKRGKVVMLVERYYPSISEEQKVFKRNEIFWPITKIQNIIEKKEPTNTLENEMDDALAY